MHYGIKMATSITWLIIYGFDKNGFLKYKIFCQKKLVDKEKLRLFGN